MKIPMQQCKKKIATLWLSLSGLLFIIILLQTIIRKDTIYAKEAWGWFFTTIMPTLSLILGVLGMDALNKSIVIRNIDIFSFRVAYYLSISYLLIVFSTILLQPLTNLDLLNQSPLWLGPFQGLTIGFLVAFFVKKEV